MGFLLRWAAAFALLAATYNPTQASYVRWALAHWREDTPLAVLFGVILVIGYAVFLTAVIRGIGTLGVVLVAALCGALVWVLADFGWLGLDNQGLNTWLALLILATVLAAGMYWGILWRRISGQVEVDDDEG